MTDVMTMVMEALACPECAAPMELRPSRFGQFYGCTRWPACDGTHGAHPNGSPLGTPANRATKDARIEALDAVLKDVQAQRALLQAEVGKATPAADRVITVALPSWSRDTNAIAIGAGCEAAVQFTRDRLPIMKAHRQMEAIP